MYKLMFCGKIFEAFPGDERKEKKANKAQILYRYQTYTIIIDDPTWYRSNRYFGSANLDLKLVRGIEFSVTLLPTKNNFNPSSRF